MKILLITSYFPPDDHIGCVRWARLAKLLTKAGHDFFVFAADNSSDTPQTKAVDFTPAMVIRVAYKSLLWSPVLKSQRALGNVILKNNSNLNHGKSIYDIMVRAWNKAQRMNRAKEIFMIMLTLAGFPHKSWPWAFKVYKQALPVVTRNGIDVIIATHPYAGCLRAANLLSKKTGIPWIADMRDGWSGDFIREIIERPLLDRLIRKYEFRLLSTAHRIVTISPELGRQIMCDPSKIVYIPNSFDQNEFDHSNKVSNNGLEVINIVYTGGVLPNHTYRIFLNALKQISSENTISAFHITYYGKKYAVLKEYADAIGLDSSILINKGYVSHSEALKAQCKADLLLVFGWHGKLSETLTTGKVIDYLGASRPIISICSPDTALGRLVNTTDAGIVLSDENDIAAFLRNLISAKRKLIRSLEAKRNLQAINSYSTENTAARYESLILSLKQHIPQVRLGSTAAKG